MLLATAVELGPGESMLCQEKIHYMFDSSKVKNCSGDQGYNSESIKQ